MILRVIGLLGALSECIFLAEIKNIVGKVL
jgi:hypothetical protein